MMKHRNKINGILLLDKPLHISSNGALQRVKRLFNAQKAGHTGSLDPLATGMLPICFGNATKLCQYLLDSDKIYVATAKLGEKTTTGDAEGEVIMRRSAEGITLEKLQQVAAMFSGEIQQIPPMYSALKHKGRPLYELARQGIEIERQPRKVTIHELRVEGLEGDVCHFFVKSSKGTYIRTLVEDIGEVLGCGAHVIGLRRLAVVPFENTAMITLPELEQVCEQGGDVGLYHHLLSLESIVQQFSLVRQG